MQGGAHGIDLVKLPNWVFWVTFLYLGFFAGFAADACLLLPATSFFLKRRKVPSSLGPLTPAC